MKSGIGYVEEILASEKPPINIVFRNLFGAEYSLKDLEQCRDTEALRYNANGTVLSHPHTPLCLCVNGLNVGRYTVGGIALTLEKFKEQTKEIQKETLKRLKSAIGDAQCLKQIRNSGNSIGIFYQIGDLERKHQEDLYVEIWKIAENLFTNEANKIRAFLRSSVPRRD